MSESASSKKRGREGGDVAGAVPTAEENLPTHGEQKLNNNNGSRFLIRPTMTADVIETRNSLIRKLSQSGGNLKDFFKLISGEFPEYSSLLPLHRFTTYYIQ